MRRMARLISGGLLCWTFKMAQHSACSVLVVR